MIKTLNCAILLFVTVCCLTACNNNEANTGPQKKTKVCISDSLSKIVHIDTAGIANIDDELKLSGEISFNDNKVVKVFPFSSGQKLSFNSSLPARSSGGAPFSHAGLPTVRFSTEAVNE